MIIDYQGRHGRHKNGEHVGIYIATGAKRAKVAFKPGANLIDPADWALVKDSNGVKRRVRARELILMEPTKQAKGRPLEGTELFEFAADECQDLIERTIDPKALRLWLMREQANSPARAPVVRMLEEQIREVTTDGNGNSVEVPEISIKQRLG